MLTVKQVAKLTEPGRYLDGHGLYLQVGRTGARSWLLRYVRHGKERLLGLGPLHTFTLDEARRRAVQARQLLQAGIDPIDAKRAARAARAKVLANEAAKRLSFEEATQKYFEQHSPTWTSARHRAQFLSVMEAYVYPTFGKLPVAAIDTALVLKVLEPLWNKRNQTAIRLRGRIEKVLDWAAVKEYRSGENPARWEGHLDQVLPKADKPNHHAALP
jgi:hypothetical protein